MLQRPCKGHVFDNEGEECYKGHVCEREKPSEKREVILLLSQPKPTFISSDRTGIGLISLIPVFV